ncbi:MAG: cell division/cell wall cluster transcriptional repressor MraZ [Prevotella sp.]|nr:cell division/cell wall cluster transcriptional repressor MraZ [Prevotella sp.]
MRFLGNIEAKADAKGRVFLPSVFRKTLQAAGEDRLILRKDVHEDCLVLYPETVWNEQMDEMRRRLNRWNRQQQQVFRQFVIDAEEVSLDTNGRFLLSQRLQEKVGIDQTVRFIGVGDVIEVWAEEKARDMEQTKGDFATELEGMMS